MAEASLSSPLCLLSPSQQELFCRRRIALALNSRSRFFSSHREDSRYDTGLSRVVPFNPNCLGDKRFHK